MPGRASTAGAAVRRRRRAGSSHFLCLPGGLSMRRLVLALFAVAALAVAAATPDRADAWEVWCFDDPVISVNGNLVDIQVQMPLDHLLTMRSTNLTIVIPSNTSGAV